MIKSPKIVLVTAISNPVVQLHNLPVSCHIIPCKWQDRREHNLCFTSLEQLSQGPKVSLDCLECSLFKLQVYIVMDCSVFSLTRFCLLDPGGYSSFTTYLHSPNVLDLDSLTSIGCLYWVLIIMWFCTVYCIGRKGLKLIGE